MANLNVRVVSLLYEVLSSSGFLRISYCDTSFEIWHILLVTHEGTTQVKETMINMIIHKLELFHMGKGDMIREIIF